MGPVRGRLSTEAPRLRSGLPRVGGGQGYNSANRHNGPSSRLLCRSCRGQITHIQSSP